MGTALNQGDSMSAKDMTLSDMVEAMRFPTGSRYKEAHGEINARWSALVARVEALEARWAVYVETYAEAGKMIDDARAAIGACKHGNLLQVGCSMCEETKPSASPPSDEWVTWLEVPVGEVVVDANGAVWQKPPPYSHCESKGPFLRLLVVRDDAETLEAIAVELMSQDRQVMHAEDVDGDDCRERARHILESLRAMNGRGR
jgi:hypothetical protein